ncbi:MAG: uncharacterized protein JWN71_825, partial [Xanthobacteraceae bacterium]|nr:uncharacterized protein [Xanthobacteraceae bacterium]
MTVTAILAVLEIYFRYQTPFHTISWPARFDPTVGFIFQPGAEVRWTNHLDFWTVQRANRWGFLDREPADTPADPTECRIAFIGDSFVEAAQVPVSDKVHVVLEKLARENASDMNIATGAFGHSGTGQLNQLPFYDEFARKLQPKIVVLVFISNDFANNSSVLEALRHGWDPDHAPRLFASRDPAGQAVLRPIDPKWNESMLDARPKRQSIRSILHDRLIKQSAFYNWFYAKQALLHPAIARFLSGADARADLTSYRARQLASRPPYQGIVKDGAPLRELDLDNPFDEKRMASVFQDAVEYTGFAFDQFLLRAKRDNFRLVVLAESILSPNSESWRSFQRLADLLKVRGIPLVSQRAYIESVDGSLSKARFEHDRHWSSQGHRWAAEAMLTFLLK